MLMRFAIVESGVCTGVTEAEEEFGLFMGWVPSLTANMGDLWDGTNFTTPPPPIPTLAEYGAVLAGFQQMRAINARNALRDQILAANPSVNSIAAFLTVLDSWPWE